MWRWRQDRRTLLGLGNREKKTRTMYCWFGQAVMKRVEPGTRTWELWSVDGLIGGISNMLLFSFQSFSSLGLLKI